ncbi:tetratricopeptide repeat protein, partial [Kitasatospora sp. NPDC056808]
MGRPWGPVRARTPEAEALALFLRKRVDESPLTMTDVAGRVPFSKSRVGAFLSGDPVPGRDFVVALVRVTVPEPVLRQRHEAEACRLREAAEHPENRGRQNGDGDLAGELERVRARQVDICERLTRAVEQRADLQQAAQNSMQLVMVLLTMINNLEGKVRTLSAERDELRARADDRAEVEDTQARLTRALNQERRAREELDRARDKQRQADELASHVEAQVLALTNELNRLRAQESDSGPSAADGAGGGSGAADPAADDIDRALARAAAVNDADDETIRRITDALQDDAQGLAPHEGPADDLIGSAVVPDNRDNPPTSTTTSDKPSGQPWSDRWSVTSPLLFDVGPEVLSADAVAARYNLAGQIGMAGDHREAADLFADVARDYERLRGPRHPSTLASRHHHAVQVGMAGGHREAADLLADLVRDCSRVLGPDHARTLTNRHHHAVQVGRAGGRAKAVGLFADLVRDCSQVLGPRHLNTLTNRHHHAVQIGIAGDHQGAADLFADLVRDYARVLGPDHARTLTNRHHHAVQVGRAGGRAKAV